MSDQGDTFEMSGDFRGAIINIKSTLTNVKQMIGSIPSADEDTKVSLEKLVQQLSDELAKIPAEKSDDAEVVAELTKEMVEKAKEEKPNRKLLEIKGENLKKAAENLVAVAPLVVGIATQIVTGILRLGIG